MPLYSRRSKRFKICHLLVTYSLSENGQCSLFERDWLARFDATRMCLVDIRRCPSPMSAHEYLTRVTVYLQPMRVRRPDQEVGVSLGPFKRVPLVAFPSLHVCNRQAGGDDAEESEVGEQVFLWRRLSITDRLRQHRTRWYADRFEPNPDRNMGRNKG